MIYLKLQLEVLLLGEFVGVGVGVDLGVGVSVGVDLGVGRSSTKFHSLGELMNLGVRFSYRNTQMMYCASQAAVGKTISIQLCRWRRTMDRPERNAKEHRCCIYHIYKNEFHEQCWPHKTLSLKSVYENS